MEALRETLRDQIRSMLREEIAALRAPSGSCTTQAVRMDTDSDLMQFACALLARAQDPGFIHDVTEGRMRFALDRTRTTYPASVCTPLTATMVASTSVPQVNPWLDKALITEKDIAAIAQGQRVLRIGQRCCLTPLAKDEARRRGIRIERNAA